MYRDRLCIATEACYEFAVPRHLHNAVLGQHCRVRGTMGEVTAY